MSSSSSSLQNKNNYLKELQKIIHELQQHCIHDDISMDQSTSSKSLSNTIDRLINLFELCSLSSSSSSSDSLIRQHVEQLKSDFKKLENDKRNVLQSEQNLKFKLNKLFACYYTFQSLNGSPWNAAYTLNHNNNDDDDDQNRDGEFVNEDFNVKCIEEELVYIPVIRFTNNNNNSNSNAINVKIVDNNNKTNNIIIDDNNGNKNRSLKGSISNLFHQMNNNNNNNDNRNMEHLDNNVRVEHTNSSSSSSSIMSTAFRSNFILFKK
ncbi:hypothetical protein DERF_013402 [Dermatophagoides farinae]|uniref:Uncharacterized protein n=1 Tax=Dermatophagoides farinae TaxID=6954 RepID=A0A922HPF3_DERFA|nr:hypothetical protein DERF_013402 [Dermatophagoides farinae]